MSVKYLTRTMKTILLVVLAIQLLATVERQVFDFLGYMWAPIIGNFFQIIAIILALFGACQHYRSCVVVYAVWSLLWLGWSIFVICLYLEVGILNRKGGRFILTLGTDSQSWWVEHGIGCTSTTHNTTTGLGSHPGSEKTSDQGVPEEYVEGCILQYYYVEVIHATVQVLLTVCGLGAALAVIQVSLERGSTGRYLARSRTYAPPPLCSPLLSSSSPPPSLISYSSSRGGWHHSHPPPSMLAEKRGRGRGGYLPMPTTSSTAPCPRDSWCLPTYVSFHHQSMDELSGSFTCGGSSISQPNPTPNHPRQHPYPNEPTLCMPFSSLREGGENNNSGGGDSGGGCPSGCSNSFSTEGLELESCGSLRSSFSSAATTSTTTSPTTPTTTTTGTTSGPYLRLNTPVESSSSSLDQTPLVEQA